MGRFITADSIVPQPFNPQTLNRYSYADNNPINFIDPSGHFSIGKFFKSLFKGLIGAIATALLTPFVGPGFAGAIVGAVFSAASGSGLKGILIGAGLGFIGGYAGGKEWTALTQAMLAAGAIMSVLNGGFEGLVNYAATVAGGYYGSKFGNDFNAQNQDTAQQNPHDGANQVASGNKPEKIDAEIVKSMIRAAEAKFANGQFPDGEPYLVADSSNDPSYWEAFGEGFAKAWGDQAESWTNTMNDILTGNWGNIENHYSNSALGQAEQIGGSVYTIEKALMVTAVGATAAAGGVVLGESVGLIETTPQGNNVLRIISKPFKRGLRFDKPGHGKGYHWHFWKW